MATFFSSTFDSDISDFSSTSGTVAWQSFGGLENSGCAAARGTLGSDSYGRCDLTSDRATTYSRCYFSLPQSKLGTFLRAQTSGSADCFTLAPIWDGRNLTFRLTVYHNSGNTVFNFDPDTVCYGLGWAEVKLTTSASHGTATVWINGECVLAETRTLPNDTKTPRYVDVGVMGAVVPVNHYIDSLTVADEQINPPDWTETTVRGPETQSLPGEKTDTFRVTKIEAAPTGGWQDIFPSLVGVEHVIERLHLCQGGAGLAAVRDKNENILWRSDAEWKDYWGAVATLSGVQCEQATQIRVENPRDKVVILAGVRYVA